MANELLKNNPAFMRMASVLAAFRREMETKYGKPSSWPIELMNAAKETGAFKKWMPGQQSDSMFDEVVRKIDELRRAW
nr:hypothetical protein [Candidatus Sigynarchaeota archaeon]